jgi:intracellular septation protein
MLSEQVQLPDAVWSRLNWSWVGFFVFMGALNLYVAFSFSENYCANVLDAVAKNDCQNNVWVNFKLFGGMGLMLVFIVVQAFVLARHVEDKQ